MAFRFEGRVLYGLLEERRLDASPYAVSAIAAHFIWRRRPKTPAALTLFSNVG